jgi:hypothetical protein
MGREHVAILFLAQLACHNSLDIIDVTVYLLKNCQVITCTYVELI